MEFSIVLSLSVLVIILFIIYIIMIYNRFGYFFSPFNVVLYLTIFELVISPVFWFDNKSWYALGIYSAFSMRPFLFKSLLINLIGLSIFYISIILFTIRGINKKVVKGSSFFEKTLDAITPSSINLLLTIAIITYISICLIFNNGTFPLFNGNRSFFYEKPFSPLYQAASLVITILGLQVGFSAVIQKKGWFLFFISFLCMLLSGNRGPALTGLVLPVCIFWATRIDTTNIEQFISKLAKNGFIKIIPVIFILLILGLSLSVLRSNNT